MLRAYDKRDGKEVGAVYMRRREWVTDDVLLNGKQYIVVAISGGNYSGETGRFKLPASYSASVSASVSSVCQS